MKIEPTLVRQAEAGSASAAPAHTDVPTAVPEGRTPAAPPSPAAATASPAGTKAAPRPMDQIHGEIVATQAQHAQLRAQAQDLSASMSRLRKARAATADKLRALRTELQAAAGAVASSVESDIAEVESFFQRLVKEL